MCINSVCTSHSAAPNDTCPLGDEYVRAASTTLTISGSYTSCENLINTSILARQAPNYYCSNEISTSCCQTCKRNSFYYIVKSIRKY